MTAPYLKKSTLLTKLPVARNPPYTLRVLYGKILKTLEKIPPDAAYRKYTEEIVRNRLSIVDSAKSVEEIEQKVNCGQAEELILQAENELILTRKFITWRPWEPLAQEPLPDQWKWPPHK